MNIFTKHNFLKTTVYLGLFCLVNVSQSAIASEHEAACKAYIQGKISWNPASNYASGSKWEDKNLAYLCKGTKDSKAPGDCFHHVTTGHVSYGNSDKWEVTNAIELCRGSDNADNTINCFKGKITDKVKWEDAIAQCQAKLPLSNVAE
jgi:hypothetical protein